ncbi:hypothetical protein ACJJTC_006681 [Scirpophaga incertulas]
MPQFEAPCIDLGSVPETPNIVESPSLSEISSASSPEPIIVRATPLFRALAMPPPEPEQPRGQDELERRLPGYRRIVIPRELTLIELLKQSSGVTRDEEVLRIREAKLRVVAERVGLRRLHVLAPRLRSLTLDGSALSSLRDLGIGLVHLKILSVNRCGLTCLDGVWGLGTLWEFYATGNRLQDLQPLAALQKLHTLNLANNPIADTRRVWMLAVCGSLRRLTLTGTPAADSINYRAQVAASLPMLVYLDDLPLHNDIDYDLDGLIDDYTESEDSDGEVAQVMQVNTLHGEQEPEMEPGPSTQFQVPDAKVEGQNDVKYQSKTSLCLRRPATTESAGSRPIKPNIPVRPRTAHEQRSVHELSRLQILNTLMDDEWECSGSSLTSHGPVYGNLALALRRPLSTRKNVESNTEKVLAEQAMQEAIRALAEEIPRAPKLEDWDRFTQETGIEIKIDFNERARNTDPAEILDRLERIEKETMERLNLESEQGNSSADRLIYPIRTPVPFMNDHDLWQSLRRDQRSSPILDVDALFNNLVID